MKGDIPEIRSKGIICISARLGSLVIGFVDVMLGLVGLSFVLLDARDRHSVLYHITPIGQEQSDTLELVDEVGESYQFLLEFWLPSFFLLILGFTLITAVVSRVRCLALLSFVLSTLFIAGCLATMLSLLISRKVGLFVFLPLSVVTLFQMYFYVVVGTFWMEAEARRCPEDKEMLVIVNKS